MLTLFFPVPDDVPKKQTKPATISKPNYLRTKIVPVKRTPMVYTSKVTKDSDESEDSLV